MLSLVSFAKMAEKKSQAQIEADILKEAQAAAAKEKKEKAPAPQKKEEKKPAAEKPSTKEKLESAAGGKGGVMKQALETVKGLREKGSEKKERKIKFERVYTVPIAKPVSRTRKTRTAMRTLRAFIFKHSKAKDVKIDQEVNHFIWARSYQKPPNKVRVSVAVDDEGLATVSLKK